MVSASRDVACHIVSVFLVGAVLFVAVVVFIAHSYY